MGNPVAESASGFLVCAESSFSDLFRYILLVDRNNICTSSLLSIIFSFWLQQRYWMGFTLEIRGLPDTYHSIRSANFSTEGFSFL